jgi:hypothetical protein
MFSIADGDVTAGRIGFVLSMRRAVAMALGRKTGGRRKGTPNRLPGEVREMVLKALDKVGGADYLAQQAQENPSAFMSLISKCLPRAVSVGGPTSIRVVTGIDPDLGEPGS